MNMNTTTYIQRNLDGCIETVDECKTRREAHMMVRYYKGNDPGADYYVSRRACKAWKENRK